MPLRLPVCAVEIDDTRPVPMRRCHCASECQRRRLPCHVLPCHAMLLIRQAVQATRRRNKFVSEFSTPGGLDGPDRPGRPLSRACEHKRRVGGAADPGELAGFPRALPSISLRCLTCSSCSRVECRPIPFHLMPTHPIHTAIPRVLVLNPAAKWTTAFATVVNPQTVQGAII